MLSLPVIDAHHRFGDAGDAGDAGAAGGHGPEDLWPELESQRISGTVLVARRSSLTETRLLLGRANSVSYVRGVVGWVDLTADVRAQIEALRTGAGGERLVALRHAVDEEDDPDWLIRADVRNGLAEVVAARLAFNLAVRSRELAAAAEACASLPDGRFVLEHLACPPIASGDLSAWGRALLELAELPNVSATLSGLVTEADHRTWSIDDLRHPVELALDAFGPERLMMGSDWPRCLAAGTYNDVIDAVRHLLAELPTYEQDEVRGTTAVRVYRLGDSHGAS